MHLPVEGVDPRGSRPGYRPDLDGLRALAVTLVVLNHAGLGFAGGFVGVDLFFVLSGFLITGIVLRELAAGNFSLAHFYERRARRIVPAFAVVAAATLAAGWALLLPVDYMALGKSTLGSALGFSNLVFWSESGYFDVAATEKPLLHTWSLGVEEQFYLVLPVLLMVLARHGVGRWLAPALCGLFALSLGASVWLLGCHPGFSFYWLPTRAWELLAGSILALWPVWGIRGRWAREAMALVGLGLIVVPALLYDKNTAFPGLAAVAPVLGAVLLIGVGGAGTSLVRTLLEWRPVVFVGTISYSLYLVHWPPMAFANYLAIAPLGSGTRVALVVVSFLLAVACWWLVETPFRHRQWIRSRGAVFGLAGAALAVLLVAGHLVQKKAGYPKRLDENARQMLASQTMDARWWKVDLGVEDLPGGLLPVVDKPVGNRVMVWGDSHAKAVLPAIEAVCRQRGVGCVAALHSGVPPLAGYARPIGDMRGDELAEFGERVLRAAVDQGVGCVVLAGFWEAYGGQDLEGFSGALTGTVRRLREAGMRVCLVKDVPRFYRNPGRAVLWVQNGLGGLGSEVTETEYASQNLVQARIFPELEALGAEVIDPLPWLKQAGGESGYVAADGRGFFYFDRDHLSVHGARAVEGAFAVVGERRVAGR